MKTALTVLALVALPPLSGCTRAIMSASERESIRRVAVYDGQSSVTIDSHLPTDPVSGAAKGLGLGLIGGVAIGGVAGPFGAASAAGILTPLLFWQGAACGTAIFKTDVDDPGENIRVLAARSVQPGTFRRALEERIDILRPDAANSPFVDATLEIQAIKISLAGSLGPCAPTLCGVAAWRLVRTSDNEKLEEKATSLSRTTTATSFKEFFADEATASADLRAFVQALGAAVADEVLLGRKPDRLERGRQVSAATIDDRASSTGAER